jgi:Replication initiation factor
MTSITYDSSTAHALRRSNCSRMVEDYDLYHHLDWLSMTGYVENIDDVEATILKYFDTWVDWSNATSGIAGHFWQAIAKSPTGIRICKNYEDGLVCQVRVEIPGNPLAYISGDESWQLCKDLHGLGLRCTRFDWAMDDYLRGLDFDLILEACDAGRFARCRVIKPHIKFVAGEGKVIEGFSCGSRQSDKFVRIYDKEIESRGTDNYADCIRYEAEFKGAYAEKIFEEFLTAPSVEIAFDLAAKYSLGCVDFIDRVDPHLNLCPVVSWWQSFIDAVGGKKRMRVSRVQPFADKVGRIINYHKRQVAKGLAILHECLGDCRFKSHITMLILASKKKFGRYEKAIIYNHHAYLKREIPAPSLV